MLTYNKTCDRIYFPPDIQLREIPYKITNEILTLIYGTPTSPYKTVVFRYHLSKENIFDGITILPCSRLQKGQYSDQKTKQLLRGKTIKIAKKGRYLNVAKLRTSASVFEKIFRSLFELALKEEVAARELNKFRADVVKSMKIHHNDYIFVDGTPENPSISARLNLKFTDVTEFQQIYGLIRGLILEL